MQPFFTAHIHPSETLATLFAAMTHDYKHPGARTLPVTSWPTLTRSTCPCMSHVGACASCSRCARLLAGYNNAFLVATNNDLAITYNDIAVLENMHVASFFRLVKDER